jgi:hypothetical protein
MHEDLKHLHRQLMPQKCRFPGTFPRWSPTLVLVARFSAYVWQSGRDAQFSLTYGRMYKELAPTLYDSGQRSLTSLPPPEERLPSHQTDRSDSQLILMDPAAARDDSSMDPLSVVEHVGMGGVS